MLPKDIRGMEQMLHIEYLPRLGPFYHMIQFFNLSKLVQQSLECFRRDTHGIWMAPASQSIAVCLKAADPILSLRSIQTLPFFSGIRGSA